MDNKTKKYDQGFGYTENGISDTQDASVFATPSIKDFPILCSETYQKLYNVTARSAEEAAKKLYEDIGIGAENAPEECVDSSMEILQPFYFTFGSDKDFPYQNGYIVIFAGCQSAAIKEFRRKYPDRHTHCINCSFVYTEDKWKQTGMGNNDQYPCYETLYACDSSGSVCKEMPREFYINTPIGKIKVYAKTNVDDPSNFPGVYVDLVKGDELVQLACVEYESNKEKLQTCVYGDGSDDAPTNVTIHENI